MSNEEYIEVTGFDDVDDFNNESDYWEHLNTHAQEVWGSGYRENTHAISYIVAGMEEFKRKVK